MSHFKTTDYGKGGVCECGHWAWLDSWI